MRKLLALFFVSLMLAPLFADGGMMIYRPDKNSWDVAHEQRQLAAINYQDGREKMLLAVEPADLSGTKIAWIFPVPAKPEDVKVGIAKEFPYFSGEEVKDKAASAPKSTGLLLMGSQVHISLPFGLLIAMTGFFPGMAGSVGSSDSLGVKSAGGWSPWYENYVTVYEHVEEGGLSTELIGTKNGGALYYYLKGRGLEMPHELQQALNSYAGKDYSFVVSWIDDVEKFKNQSEAQQNQGQRYGYGQPQGGIMAVSVDFPTDRIYFPMIPTSIYGKEKVPAWIYVVGHVTPEVYKEITGFTEETYYIDDSYTPQENSADFFGTYKEIRNFKFTKIYINSASENFKDDLWMKNSAPLDIVAAGIVAENSLLFTILLFAIISCLASVIAGLVIFKDAVSKQRLAAVGLANFLTVIGFAAATYWLVKPKKACGVHCRLKFVALFSGICFAAGIITLLLSGWNSSSSGSLLGNAMAFLTALVNFLIVLAVVILPQMLVAYGFFHYLKVNKSKLFYVLGLLVADILVMLIGSFTLAVMLIRSSASLVSWTGILLVLAILICMAEGWLLHLLAKKEIRPRMGALLAVLMKIALAAAIFLATSVPAILRFR